MDKPRNQDEYMAISSDLWRKLESIKNTNQEIDELITTLEKVSQADLEGWGWSKPGAEKLGKLLVGRKAAWESIKEHEIVKEGIPKVL